MSELRANIEAAAVTLVLCGVGFLLGLVVAVVWAAWGGW